jgi:signal transduction histidine kinase
MSTGDSTDESQGRFLEHLAHELRGPSGVALGALSQLELGPDAERTRTLIAMVRRSVKKVLLMADRLQRTGELHARRAQWEFQPYDLKDLVERSVEAAAAVEARRGIDLDLRHPGTKCVLSLDADWLSAAVTELVVRAILSARTRVVVTIEESPERVVLTISHDGLPMPSPLPERFTASLAEQGLGLALSFAADVAEAHGASFTAGEPCSGEVTGSCTRFAFARSTR